MTRDMDTIKMSYEEMIDTLKGLVFGTFDRTTVKEREALDMAIKALQAEPCEDCVSRKSLKHKLQERHDFFVDAYGGFINLPQKDKARVDTIATCIAMVVNEPPIKPIRKKGKWVLTDDDMIYCSECEDSYYPRPIDASWKYCPNCGAEMEGEE